MFPLRALLPLRRWVAVVPVAGFAIALGCQSPDEFYRYTDANMSGAAGTSASGVAGTIGTGGGVGGTGVGPTGAGGASGATGTGNTVGSGGSTGVGGSGPGSGGSAAPAGAAGSVGGGVGGSSARGGAGGTVTAGAGGAIGSGGAIGTAGATGAGGRGGASGAIGAGGSAGGAGGRGGGNSGGATGAGGAAGTTGAGGGAAGATGAGGAATTPGRIEVVALCQSTNGMQDIRVTFKILNPESVTKQWSDIKVRYYFTPTVQLPAMVTFDYAMKFQTTQLTSTVGTNYVEVGFMTGTGTVAGFDNVTGSDQIQLHLYNYGSPMWNASQDDDYSYLSCAGVTNTSAYVDRTTMPGYYQGQLAWGVEPPQ